MFDLLLASTGTLDEALEAIQAARQIIERFGEVKDAYDVLIYSYLSKGDGRRALAAIDKHDVLTSGSGAPALAEPRQQALQLIARQQASTSAAPAGTEPAGHRH